MKDWCGYCGQQFERRPYDPPEICQDCLADPDVKSAYITDNEIEMADRANERDLADRARRGK